MRYRTLTALSLILSVGLSACETTGTPPPATIAHDHCVLDREITYSAPAAGQQDSAANTLDTPETVAQIVQHNIVFTRTCPPSAQ